jgi:phage virion morphogenesis protein
MVGIEAKVETKNEFLKLYDKLKNKKELNLAIVEDIRSGIMQNFDTESNDGKSWQALKLSTLKNRQRKKRPYPMYKMLQINPTTGLKGSIQTQADENGGQVYTSKIYARALHYGNAKRKLPARPFMTITKNAAAHAKITFKKWIEEKKNEVF